MERHLEVSFSKSLGVLQVAEAKIRIHNFSVQTSAVNIHEAKCRSFERGPLGELELSSTSGRLTDDEWLEEIRNVESVRTAQGMDRVSGNLASQ